MIIGSGEVPQHNQRLSYAIFFNAGIFLILSWMGFFGILGKKLKWIGALGFSIMSLAAVALSGWYLTELHDKFNSSVASEAFSFLSFVFLIWFARLNFWISWQYSPGPIEFKIQDIFVAALAATAVLSRWASITGIGVTEWDPLFHVCGSSAFGLLLAKYTYELIDLVASRRVH